MAKTYSKHDPIMAELRALLVSHPVMKIQFRFGTYQILSLDFRHLALELSDSSSHVTIRVDPDELDKLTASKSSGKVTAAYNPTHNQCLVRNAMVMRDPIGRSELVHESVHAIFDLRNTWGRDLARECACYAAHIWYGLEAGIGRATMEKHDVPELIDLVAGVRARGEAPAAFRPGEVLKMRRILRRDYKYRPGLTGPTRGFKFKGP